MISMACAIIGLVVAIASIVLYSLHLGTRKARYAEALGESRRRAAVNQEREHTRQHLESLRKAKGRDGMEMPKWLFDTKAFYGLDP